jgi:hypothetical protein
VNSIQVHNGSSSSMQAANSHRTKQQITARVNNSIIAIAIQVQTLPKKRKQITQKKCRQCQWPRLAHANRHDDLWTHTRVLCRRFNTATKAAAPLHCSESTLNVKAIAVAVAV